MVSRRKCIEPMMARFFNTCVPTFKGEKSVGKGELFMDVDGEKRMVEKELILP